MARSRLRSFACAGCGKDDQSQAVPALFDAGRSWLSGTFEGVSVGGVSGFGMTRERGSFQGAESSALSAAIAPGPVIVTAGGLTRDYLMLALGSCLLLSPLVISGGAIMAFISVFGLVMLGVYVPATAREARTRALVLRGYPEAFEVWSSATYCHRCGAVTLAEDEVLYPAEFQRLVWGTGGYGHLHK